MSTVNRTKPNDHSSEMDDEGVYCAEKSCRIAGALARLGNATDTDIAAALGIGISDFRLWKDTQPEFAQALKTPPSFSDSAVERAVLRTALGYSYTTEKLIETREGGVVRSLTIHVPPNVEALEFLLRARLPRLYGAEVAKGPFDYLFDTLESDNLRRPRLKSHSTTRSAELPM
jgi:hypothetical protein